MGWNRISYPMYTDFRDRNQVFSGMFCLRETSMSLTYEGRTERVSGEFVSGNYFPVLGVTRRSGGYFTADDDQVSGRASTGRDQLRILAAPVRRRSAASLAARLSVNGLPLTIIGVSQAGFSGTDPGSAPEVRVPMMMSTKLEGYLDLNDRRSRWVTAFGRMKPGVTLQVAKASLQPIFHQILDMEVKQAAFAKAAPEMKQAFLRMSMDVMPAAKGRSHLRRQFSKPLLVLMATVALVLLIACANVANLLDRPGSGATKGDRRPAGAGREPVPHRHAIAGREPAAVRDGRSGRTGPGDLDGSHAGAVFCRPAPFR